MTPHEEGPRPRVLVVDDEDIALEILCETLEKSGYDPVALSDGAEAWRRIQEDQFRIVLTDWEMPGIDGLELCRRIRSRDPLAYTYVILISAHDEPQDLVTGLAAGADDFLAKPANPAELEVRLRNAERVVSLESRDVTIFALAKLVESRDPETGTHLERIQAYCRLLARDLTQHPDAREFVDEGLVHMIVLTCPMHDIGKTGIPDSILLKPGRLNDEEFDVMKTHTRIGGDTLTAALEEYPAADFLRMSRDIALHHHERYDGSGYPAGLAAEDIPLSARIVALADVYDALISKRVYKEAFALGVSRDIILEGRGKHFDPQIVDAFLNCEGEFRRVSETVAG